MKPLKLATYNINGVRKRLPILLEWLAKEAPDIVCLQELKATDAAFPIAEIRAAGYGARWHGQQSWNGVAILARGDDPLERRRGLPGDPSDDQSRYIECAAHGLLVGCLYLPNGNPQPGPKFDYKLAWFERLIKHAEPLCSGEYPVVLAGDYNVVPTDFDIYDTKSWKKDALLQPESRECYRRLLGQGWTDSLRKIHPEQIFTFWDYFRQHWQRNAGLRIDHLLLNPNLAPRLLDAGVDRWVRDLEGTSDHAPTWITLDMASATATPGEQITTKTAAKKTATKKVSKAPAKTVSKAANKKTAKTATKAVAKKATGKTTGASAKKSASRKKT
ncbi:MAG TPA: exodeoxyribonuclease III [Nannocystis sp.]